MVALLRSAYFRRVRAFADRTTCQGDNENQANELFHRFSYQLLLAINAKRSRKMIKVAVMYPNKPGARFNHEYYRDKHMPLVKTRMGDSCKYYTVDKGLAGGAPGVAPPYVCMGHLFCDSVEAFQTGFGPHAQEILGDIPNYTDQNPVIQISEVVVG